MPEPATPSPEPKRYTLKFEPVGTFDETELFVKGTVRGKVWLTDSSWAQFKSLTGEEVDQVNSAVKVTPQTTAAQYNTDVTYHNLARALEELAGAKVTGSIEERIARLRGMSSAVLGRLTMAYLEFNEHVDGIFAGKGVADLAKKS